MLQPIISALATFRLRRGGFNIDFAVGRRDLQDRLGREIPSRPCLPEWFHVGP
jgi:hypothetical protein